MCILSNIIQDRQDYWPTYPNWRNLDQEELARLREEVEQLKRLIPFVKQVDEASGQPECENDKKVEFVKQLAEFLGVDLEDCL